MKPRVSLLFWLALLPIPAVAQNAAITVWPKGVPPEGITTKVNFGDHILSISHREKDGRVEIHQKKADVMVIQSGTATLIYGGTIIDPVTTGLNEIQGSRIEGGAKRTVSAGDVIEVPAGVPHQFLLTDGKPITYLLVKIVKP